MKRLLKVLKIIFLVIAIIYIALCVLCKLTYRNTLDSLISESTSVYSANYEKDVSAAEKIFSVSTQDNTVCFRKTSNFYIDPFNIAAIPYLQAEIKYDLNSPDYTINCKDSYTGNIIAARSDGLFIVCDTYIVSSLGIPEKVKYYFGFCPDAYQLENVDTFDLQYAPQEASGYIFVFTESANQDFDVESLN
ncbi:MAG: hypothetical protein LUE06_04655 [Oscillospiraceae bacterium]|nr:hypothetical protein [Oscillospiraceae bacterium]